MPSAHIDTFARDNLPPPNLWPDFLLDRPEFQYPDWINVGTGTAVSFASDAAALDVVEVTGDMVNPIDLSSVESTSIFTEAQFDAVPVARNVTGVALLAPGTAAAGPPARLLYGTVYRSPLDTMVPERAAASET